MALSGVKMSVLGVKRWLFPPVSAVHGWAPGWPVLCRRLRAAHRSCL